MTAESGADAPHTVDEDGLAELRRVMLEDEPNWPYVASELARQLQLLQPLVAGTVQGMEAEHALADYRAELGQWLRSSDRYYAAFDKTITS